MKKLKKKKRSLKYQEGGGKIDSRLVSPQGYGSKPTQISQDVRSFLIKQQDLEKSKRIERKLSGYDPGTIAGDMASYLTRLQPLSDEEIINSDANFKSALGISSDIASQALLNEVLGAGITKGLNKYAPTIENLYKNSPYSPLATSGFPQEAPQGLIETTKKSEIINPYLIQQPSQTSLSIKSVQSGNPLEKQLSKSGEININNIKNYINKPEISQGDKYVINKVLDEQFPSHTKIDYNTFKQAVSNELIPLNRTITDKYSNVGVDRLGYTGPKIENILSEIKNTEANIETSKIHLEGWKKYLKDVDLYKKEHGKGIKGWEDYYNRPMSKEDIIQDIKNGIKRKEEDIVQYSNQLEKNKQSLNNRPLENNSIVFDNPNQLGSGDKTHFGANTDNLEPLGHSRYMVTKDEPDIFHLLESQSDYYQKGSSDILDKLNKDKTGTLIDNYSRKSLAKESTASQYKAVLDDLKYKFENNILDEQGHQIHPIQIQQLEEIVNKQAKETTLSKAELQNWKQKHLLGKSHQERLLQESVDFAAKNGQSKVRVPTSESAAKIEAYPVLEEPIESLKNELKSLEIKNKEKKGVLFEIEQKLNRRHVDEMTEYDKLPDIINRSETRIKYQSDEEKQRLLELKNKILTNDLFKTGFDPKHQTILKKYDDMPKVIKKTLGVEPKTVTDSKGNSWYEFDIPKSYKEGKAEIKAFAYGGTGYQQDSPDVNNDSNLIDSNHITMDKVKKKLMLIPIDENGKKGKPVLARPGDTDYYFPDYSSVLEIPTLKDGGNWIQSAHLEKGRCTPGSPNYDCPKGSPQWNLAQTFKKHHGFHKQDGGTISEKDITPYITSNINDPRFQQYTDSMKIYKAGIESNYKLSGNISEHQKYYDKPALSQSVIDKIQSTVNTTKGQLKPYDRDKEYTLSDAMSHTYKEIYKNNEYSIGKYNPSYIIPARLKEGDEFENDPNYNFFKRPVQPVVYQPAPKPILSKDTGYTHISKPAKFHDGGEHCTECDKQESMNFEKDNIFTEKKNNFVDWLKNKSMDVLKYELDNQEGFHTMPDGSVMKNSEMNDIMGYEAKYGGKPRFKKKGVPKLSSYCGGPVNEACITAAINDPDPRVRQMAAFTKRIRGYKFQDGGTPECSDQDKMTPGSPCYNQNQSGQFPDPFGQSEFPVPLGLNQPQNPQFNQAPMLMPQTNLNFSPPAQSPGLNQAPTAMLGVPGSQFSMNKGLDFNAQGEDLNKPGISNVQSQGSPGQKKTTWGANPAAANLMIAGMEGLTNIFSQDEKQNREKYQKGMTHADQVFGSVQGDRGDYSVNEGYFRPDEQVPVQFTGKFGGQYKYQRGGQYYMSDKEIQSLIDQGYQLDIED